MKIIPAIDIIDGKCVRLTEGNYATQKTYSSNPLELAIEFEDYGIQHLHLVDLDGAKAGKIINWKTLETIASKTKLTIDFGGGVKSNDDLNIAFNCGASKITGGSIAVTNSEMFTQWLYDFKEKIILGTDVKDEKIAINGWIDKTDISLFDFIDNYLLKGLTQIICTDIFCDGKLEGPNFELYKKLKAKYNNLKITASGGISCIDDIRKCIDINIDGVIIGKAIYEGKISLNEIKKIIVNAR